MNDANINIFNLYYKKYTTYKFMFYNIIFSKYKQLIAITLTIKGSEKLFTIGDIDL